MLADTFHAAWTAMAFNRRRSAITVLGMAWGIATVVLLLAMGTDAGGLWPTFSPASAPRP